MKAAKWMIGIAMMATPVLATAQDTGLGWMLGMWATRSDAGNQTLERWDAEKGVLTGASEVRAFDVVRSWETLRIQMEQGRAVYYASPGGGQAVPFVEVSRGPQQIVFENRTHDYPQRIRYWREGDQLVAEISLADGSKPMRWTYCRIDQNLRVAPPCGEP